MVSLVVGGAASGKSEYAEGLVLAAGGAPRIYIATMQPFDAECRARIAGHRAMRAEKQFSTIECYTGLAGARLPQNAKELLECLGNLAANELYSPGGAGPQAAGAIVGGVRALAAQAQTLVIVSNEVCAGGRRYAGDTLRYLELMAEINRQIAALADNVCEVVCGLPHYYKGGPGCANF